MAVQPMEQTNVPVSSIENQFQNWQSSIALACQHLQPRLSMRRHLLLCPLMLRSLLYLMKGIGAKSNIMYSSNSTTAGATITFNLNITITITITIIITITITIAIIITTLTSPAAPRLQRTSTHGLRVIGEGRVGKEIIRGWGGRYLETRSTSLNFF
jgi:hypothetical protein